MTRDQILAEARTLGSRDREILAEEIWLSLDAADDASQIDAEWLDVARRRDAAAAAGALKTGPLDDVMARLSSKGKS
jgi:hypothetical protein